MAESVNYRNMRIWRLMAVVAAFVGLVACSKEEPVVVEVQSISLDNKEIELGVGDKAVLVATVLPVDADDKTVVWSSADPSVATVAGGTVTAVKVGETKITATAAGFSAECAVNVFFDAPAVDLGLSVKWAAYNIGAQKPEDYGSYFAWGETAQKAVCEWSKEGDYKWGVYGGDQSSPLYGMTKYTGDVEGGDGINTLVPGDDAATVNWGSKWRTPTYEEFEELYKSANCEWTWNEEKKGCTITSIKNGNSIFLPAAGALQGSEFTSRGTYGLYWSSRMIESYTHCAVACSFSSVFADFEYAFRYCALSVRPVRE